ncbi:MAG: hypothetical protein ACLFR1_14680 [Spirochaetia bacterium]
MLRSLFSLLFLFLCSGLLFSQETDDHTSDSEAAAQAEDQDTALQDSEQMPDIFPAAFLGMELSEAYEEFGVPESVYSVRGEEEWQDDVVFYFPSHIYLFWYNDRIWQVRLDSRFSGEMMDLSFGMAKEAVRDMLGPPLRTIGSSDIYQLPDQGYPVRCRIVYNEGILDDFYVYRADF